MTRMRDSTREKLKNVSVATLTTKFEDFVTSEAQNGRSILGLYPATDDRSVSASAAWRAADGC